MQYCPYVHIGLLPPPSQSQIPPRQVAAELPPSRQSASASHRQVPVATLHTKPVIPPKQSASDVQTETQAPPEQMSGSGQAAPAAGLVPPHVHSPATHVSSLSQAEFESHWQLPLTQLGALPALLQVAPPPQWHAPLMHVSSASHTRAAMPQWQAFM